MLLITGFLVQKHFINLNKERIRIINENSQQIYGVVNKHAEVISEQARVIKSTGGILSTWTWTFKPENGKTLVNLVVEYTIPVPVLGKVAEQLVLRQNEREADLAITNLKERLEG